MKSTNPVRSKRAFARVMHVKFTLGKLHYYHPTKGWRFRSSPLASNMSTAADRIAALAAQA